MKSKEYEELVTKYEQDFSKHNIKFFCKKCKKQLEVIKVISHLVPTTTNGKTKDYRTWIYVVCHNCKTLSNKKFYWKNDGGKDE